MKQKARVNRCQICGKIVDESTRYNSIQEFEHVVCSTKCGLRAKELEVMSLDDLLKEG